MSASFDRALNRGFVADLNEKRRFFFARVIPECNATCGAVVVVEQNEAIPRFGVSLGDIRLNEPIPTVGTNRLDYVS